MSHTWPIRKGTLLAVSRPMTCQGALLFFNDIHVALCLFLSESSFCWNKESPGSVLAHSKVYKLWWYILHADVIFEMHKLKTEKGMDGWMALVTIC